MRSVRGLLGGVGGQGGQGGQLSAATAEVVLSFLREWSQATRLQRAWRLCRRRRALSRCLDRPPASVWCSLTGELQPRAFCVPLVRRGLRLWLHAATLCAALEVQAGPSLLCPVTRTPLDACELRRVAGAGARRGACLTDPLLRSLASLPSAHASRAAALHAMSEDGREAVAALRELALGAGSCPSCVSDAVAVLCAEVRDLCAESVDEAAELLCAARRQLHPAVMAGVYEGSAGTALSAVLVWSAYRTD